MDWCCSPVSRPLLLACVKSALVTGVPQMGCTALRRQAVFSLPPSSCIFVCGINMFLAPSLQLEHGGNIRSAANLTISADIRQCWVPASTRVISPEHMNVSKKSKNVSTTLGYNQSSIPAQS